MEVAIHIHLFHYTRVYQLEPGPLFIKAEGRLTAKSRGVSKLRDFEFWW